MQLYSTNNKENIASLATAVMKGLPDDNGLFMPIEIPKLPQSFFDNLEQLSFQEIAFEICKNLFQDYIPEEDLRGLIEKAVNFPAPVESLDNETHVLELFHGPSLAFKDFGARFMAQLMSYFNKGNNNKELVILVATSGDTGGAVAAGFYKTSGIKVVILYPSGKVSLLQEKQLTTLGYNIEAIEVEGTFDDCQALVKQAFLDKDLNQGIRLSSANSINIARLIPQSFYYFEAYKQLKDKSKPVAFVVPSGNFGNLTAGLLAKMMGLPIDKFVAATNANDVVPQYLKTGDYKPRPSVPTISNAMDVGAPSNFARMLDIYGKSWVDMKSDIHGFSYNDEETRVGVKEVYDEYAYVMDPHGAVAYLALRDFQKSHPNYQGVILETAHPSKFVDEVESTLKTSIEIPERLEVLREKKKEATLMDTSYDDFRSYLLERHS